MSTMEERREEVEAQMRDGSRCSGTVEGKPCRRAPAPGDLFCPDHRPPDGLIVYIPERLRQRVARFCNGSLQERDFIKRAVLEILERLERT